VLPYAAAGAGAIPQAHPAPNDVTLASTVIAETAPPSWTCSVQDFAPIPDDEGMARTSSPC